MSSERMLAKVHVMPPVILGQVWPKQIASRDGCFLPSGASPPLNLPAWRIYYENCLPRLFCVTLGVITAKFCNLEVPWVRLSISGVKSGTHLETPWKRSQSKFRISRFRTVGDPQTLENKADSLPSELCYPQYGWYLFLFWKAPPHGTARAGHEIPNSTGGTSE